MIKKVVFVCVLNLFAIIYCLILLTNLSNIQLIVIGCIISIIINIISIILNIIFLKRITS